MEKPEEIIEKTHKITVESHLTNDYEYPADKYTLVEAMNEAQEEFFAWEFNDGINERDLNVYETLGPEEKAKKDKVFLVVNSGIHDYNDFHNILIMTIDKNEAIRVYNERVKDIKIEFDDYEDTDKKIETETSSNEFKFEMYLEGHSVDHSNTVEILEMDIEKDKYIDKLQNQIQDLKDLTKRFKLKDYSLKQLNIDIIDTVYTDVVVAYDYPEEITDDFDKYLAYVGENLKVTKFNYVASCNITEFVNNHKDIYVKAFNWNREYDEAKFVCYIFAQTLTGNASDRFYKSFIDLVNNRSLANELEKNEEIDITD